MMGDQGWLSSAEARVKRYKERAWRKRPMHWDRLPRR